MWDDFAAVPGRIKDGTTADPACDHVHRLDADLDLLSWLGVDAYRFSISWPRVQPGGSGPLSSTGMDFYSRLIDGLLARGIHPVATLYHWDLPSELNDAGGWLTRDTADRFGDYAGFMAQAFGDRVAVLNAGVLQQVASPRELYESPANAFVGAFIGSPSMNIVQAPIVDGGVLFGDYTVAVDRSILSKAGSAKTVLLGIRPEDLHISDEGTQIKVSLVEELGADAYVYGDTPQIDGTAISVIAREPGSIGTRIGDVVRVKPRRHYIFDANNAGLRLSE